MKKFIAALVLGLVCSVGISQAIANGNNDDSEHNGGDKGSVRPPIPTILTGFKK